MGWAHFGGNGTPAHAIVESDTGDRCQLRGRHAFFGASLGSCVRITRSMESEGVPAIGSFAEQEGQPGIANGAVNAMRFSWIWSQPGPCRTSHAFPLPCGNRQPHRQTLSLSQPPHAE
jgi:hypothetical protein